MNRPRILIDASNIDSGGGITHITEVCRHIGEVEEYTSRVVIYARQHVLSIIPDHKLLLKCTHPLLSGGVVRRALWQQFALWYAARLHRCDVIWSLGGIIPIGGRISKIAMSHNMLPFEHREQARYGWSINRVRLGLLRIVQGLSIRRARGVIFLSDFAREHIVRTLDLDRSGIAVIPHGVDEEFRCPPRKQQPLTNYSTANPVRVLYVSTVDVYKHQGTIAEAVAKMRRKGLPIRCDFIGGGKDAPLRAFRKKLSMLDPEHIWLNYQGSLPYSRMSAQYRKADVFIFGSSCENMPNILLEAMASGLPIACASKRPMSDILGGNGIYFDPEDIDSTVVALETLLRNEVLRQELAQGAYRESLRYSWAMATRMSFRFMAEVSRNSDDASGPGVSKQEQFPICADSAVQ